jgi:hypothetical protein
LDAPIFEALKTDQPLRRPTRRSANPIVSETHILKLPWSCGFLPVTKGGSLSGFRFVAPSLTILLILDILQNVQ